MKTENLKFFKRGTKEHKEIVDTNLFMKYFGFGAIIFLPLLCIVLGTIIQGISNIRVLGFLPIFIYIILTVIFIFIDVKEEITTVEEYTDYLDLKTKEIKRVYDKDIKTN